MQDAQTAARSRAGAALELDKLGGEYPSDRTIEHAAAAAVVSIAFDLARIAAVLEAWQASSAWDGGRI